MRPVGKKLDYFLRPGSVAQDEGGVLADVDSRGVYTAIEAILGTTGRSFWGTSEEYVDGYNTMVSIAEGLLMDAADRIIRAMWQMRSSQLNTALDPNERGLYPTSAPVGTTIQQVYSAVQTMNIELKGEVQLSNARLQTIIDRLTALLTYYPAGMNASDTALMLDLLGSIKSSLLDDNQMAPTTAVGALITVVQLLSQVSSEMANVNDALRTDEFGLLSEGPEHTIANLVSSGLYGRSDNLSFGQPLGLTYWLTQQLGWDNVNTLRSRYPALDKLNELTGILGQLQNTTAGTPSLTTADQLWRLEQAVNSLIGQFATPDHPSPVRNRIEDISEGLGTLMAAVNVNTQRATESRDLLQQLLNCTPCDGASPDTPTLCDPGTGSFIRSTGWEMDTDPVTGDITYIARLGGGGTDGFMTYSVQRVSDAVPGRIVDVFEAEYFGLEGESIDIDVCVSWEGDSGQWSTLAVTPALTTVLYQGSMNILSPAPANVSYNRSAHKTSNKERSRWYVRAINPVTPGSPPPTGATVFIIPRASGS